MFQSVVKSEQKNRPSPKTSSKFSKNSLETNTDNSVGRTITVVIVSFASSGKKLFVMIKVEPPFGDIVVNLVL